jgi:hypothetical protein
MHDDEIWREPVPTLERPTLLSSCARAATAAEARFRVDYPNARPRASRIFALDQGAAEAMFRITEDRWNGAHFLTVAAAGIDADSDAAALPLARPDGNAARLPDEIEGADLVVLIAAEGSGAGAARVIAREAWQRRIMCVALALGGGSRAEAVVNELRPLASVLVVARDVDFIPAMLSALRA